MSFVDDLTRGVRSGRYVRPLVRELSDFSSRDGSYDYSGSADVQQAAAENGAAASLPEENPNEPEAVKVRAFGPGSM